MSVGARFDRFLSHIEPTTAQKASAATTHSHVRDFLEGEYSDSSSFLIGSYKKDTLVRPPTDIDIMFVLPYSDYARVNAWTGNKQSRLLQEIKSKLDSRYTRTGMRADGPVVQVFFTHFKVEIAPCFKLSDGTYWICNTKSGGEWKVDDPVAQMVALTESNKLTSGNTKRLIKMMKVWRNECSVPLRSFALELLVMDFMTSYQYADETSTYYDWMVRDFLGYLKEMSNKWLFAAGTFEVVFPGDEWLTQAESAFNRAEKAVKFEADEMPFTALEEWRKIFGNLFPG